MQPGLLAGKASFGSPPECAPLDSTGNIIMLQAISQVRLIAAVAGHCLCVRHPPERLLYMRAQYLPNN
jgi:hypothetical protein